MANIKSQIKRNRQNLTHRARNKSVMSGVRSTVKRVVTAAEAGESTDEPFRAAQQTIDRAVSKGVLHPKTAARKKARLAAKIS